MRKTVVYRNYIEKNGKRQTIIEIGEKVSNLSLEINKFLQYKKNHDTLQHAIANMEVGIDLLKKIFNPNDINKHKGKKIKQLIKFLRS